MQQALIGGTKIAVFHPPSQANLVLVQLRTVIAHTGNVFQRRVDPHKHLQHNPPAQSVAAAKGHLYRHTRAHPIRQCKRHRIIVVTVQIKEGALHSHGGNGAVLCFVAHFISA